MSVGGLKRDIIWLDIKDNMTNGIVSAQHHGVKFRDFTLFLGMEILWKGTVSAEFWAIHPKHCRY